MTKYYKFAQYLLAAVLLALPLASCGDDDDDSGSSANISVNVTNINLPSTKGSERTFSIITQASWSISNVPTWASVSATAGTGSTTITVAAKSENESDQSRSAVLTISTATASCTITITQEAGLEACTVTPANITLLSYGMACNFEATSNVVNYRAMIMPAFDYEGRTTPQLLEDLEEYDLSSLNNQSIYRVWFDSEYWTEQADFYILSVAYDVEGNRGALQATKVTKPAWTLENEDARADIDVYLSSGYVCFECSKLGRANKYDVIYGVNVPSMYTNSNYLEFLLAFEMQYYRNNGKKHWLANNFGLVISLDYPNDYTFKKEFNTSASNQGVVCATRGIFENGSLSSYVSIWAGTITTSSSIPARKAPTRQELQLQMEASQKTLGKGFQLIASPTDLFK